MKSKSQIARGAPSSGWRLSRTLRFGALLTLTAALISSLGVFAVPPPTGGGGGQPQGNGVVTVTSTTSCVGFTPAKAGGNDNWEVVRGGSYTMTISGVTECTGTAITVFAQNSQNGNFCFNAAKVSDGVYSGDFTMPTGACFTSPLSYKCGADAACSLADSYQAKGPGADSVHLRASTFAANCVLVGPETTCDPIVKCTLTATPDDQVVCVDDGSGGFSATITPHVEGNVGSLTYSWKLDGESVSGSASLVLTESPGLGVHTYEVLITDTGVPDCAVTVTGTLEVLDCVGQGCPVKCPEDKTIECTDSTDPSVTGEPKCSSPECAATYSDKEEADASCKDGVIKLITRTWTCMNTTDNSIFATCVQHIFVKDTTAPEIQNDQGSDTTVECSAYSTTLFKAPTAKDACDPNPTVELAKPDEVVAGNCAGSYQVTRTWQAKDSCGNVSANTVSQTITVVDTTPPQLVTPAGKDTTVECPTPITDSLFTPPVFADACGTVSYDVETTTETTACGLAVVTKTWVAKDDCGNPADAVSQTISQTDTTPPTLSGGSATSTSCGVASFTDPTANDTCGSATVAQDGSDTITKIPNSGTYTVKRCWIATDACGNKSESYCLTATVTECKVTGGLTIGYWQNKNGQAWIANNYVAVRTALRSYVPFQDLSATATANGVQTYVLNVIKAANASGAAMNAMLKAQMMATVLDVCVTPSLGGAVIDLTYVNKPIGSASYENTSAAFGGASCKTVSALLSDAAAASNVGGSVWYGQVKTTQELAKDTFDAINNNVAVVAPYCP